MNSPIASAPATSAALRPWSAAIRPDRAVTHEEDRLLKRLLHASFLYEPAFLTRRYLHLPPAYRCLMATPAGEIVAHAAIYEKSVGTVCGELKVAGVGDVCVAASHRGRGLLRELFAALHPWLEDHDFPFAMLFGQPKIYRSSGYVEIHNELRASNGLLRHWNPFCGKPMIHALSATPWPEGEIDLHGPTF